MTETNYAPDESHLWSEDNFEDLVEKFKEQQEDLWKAYTDEKFHIDMDSTEIKSVDEDIYATWIAECEDDLNDTFVAQYQGAWDKMVTKAYEERR